MLPSIPIIIDLLRYEFITYGFFVLLFLPVFAYSILLRVGKAGAKNKYTQEVNFIKKINKIIIYSLIIILIVFSIFPIINTDADGPLGFIFLAFFQYHFIFGAVGIAYLAQSFILFYTLKKLEKNNQTKKEILYNFGGRVKKNRLGLIIIGVVTALSLIFNANHLFPHNPINGAYRNVWDGDETFTDPEDPPGLIQVPLE